VNEADLTDGVGAESNEFPAPPVELLLTETTSSEEEQT
jgi:hypothetical protein